MKRRILSIVLVLAMLLSMFPTSIFAEGEDTTVEPVGVTEVGTYEELVKALAEGGNIKLMENIEWSNGYNDGETIKIAAGKDVTIDLNGKTMSQYVKDVGLSVAAIAVLAGAELTIVDNSEDKLGKICACSTAVQLEGTLNLKSGTIEVANPSKTDINPDKGWAWPIWIYKRTEDAANPVFNMSGGAIDISDAQMDVFYEIGYANAVACGNGVGSDLSMYSGVEVNITGGTVVGSIVIDKDATVVAPADVAVWRVNEEGYIVEAAIGEETYLTLADAIADAKDGDTVTLLGDVKLSSELYLSKIPAITIDGNGYTVSAAEDAFANSSSGQNNLVKVEECDPLVIKNITLKTSALAKHVLDVASTKVVLENVVLDDSAEKTAFSACLIVNNADVTIKGTFEAKTNAASYYAINVGKGATNLVPGAPTLRFDESAKVTFVSEKAFIFADADATVSVPGGTYNGTFEKGFALSYVDGAYTAIKCISGGTFASKPEAEYLAELPYGYYWDFEEVKEAGDTIGYKLVKIEKDHVAQIGETHFYTLADAIAAAKDGDTVTLLADIVAEMPNNNGYAYHSVYSIDKSITLDGAGHTISVNTDNWQKYNDKPTGHIFTVGVEDTRLVQGEANDVDVIIKNLTFEGDDAGYARDAINAYAPRTLPENTTASTKLTLDNVIMYHFATYSVGVNNSDVTVKNSIIGDGDWGYAIDVSKGTANLTVESGEVGTIAFVAHDSNVAQTGIIKAGYIDGILVGNKAADIAISGGTFGSEIDTKYLVDGYAFVKNAEGNFEVKVAEKVETPDVPVIEDVVVGDTNVTVEVKDPSTVVEPTVEEVKHTEVKVETNNSEATEAEKEEAAKEAAEALTESISNIEVEVDKIAVEQALNVTAEEITEKAEELQESAEAAGETITNIKVETTVSMEIKVDEAALAAVEDDDEKAVSFMAVNITPVVTKTFTAENEHGEKIASVSVTEEAKVTKEITVKIPLPAKYFKAGQQMTVIHSKDNSTIKYYHPVTVQQDATGLYVEFVNENGFSGFGIAPAHKVTFVDTKGAAVAYNAMIIVDEYGNKVKYEGTLSEGKYYYAINPLSGYLAKVEYGTIEVGAEDMEVTVLCVPAFVTELGDLPAMIATYYDAIYEIAYWMADNKGYVDVAVDGLEIALESLDIAKEFVNVNAPAEYDAIKNEMLNELDNTKETLSAVIALLQGGVEDVDSLIAAVLSLEDQMWKHFETLSKLGYELGIEIDPYLIKLNDAVVYYAKMVDTTVVDTYNMIVETVDGFVEDYAAWVESVGAAADKLHPELGEPIRKFLTETPADALAILAAYGEEAIFELCDVAVDAAGDIADVALKLADVMTKHGLTIYNAVKDNAEVQELLEAIKVQLGEIEPLVKEIAELKAGEAVVGALLADKEALLQKLYDELAIHYNKLYALVISVVDDVDPIAAEALDDALTALCDVLTITCDAAEGYLGWLAGHAEAMGAELLTSLLDNLYEFAITAGPVIDELIWALLAKIDAAILKFLPIADQWLYDWLYNNPDKVIAFFTEYGDEISALMEEYGDEVLGILGYIAYTYGPEVLEFVIENPCEALDMFMKWYNKYGYRIWPMIDVYLEALGVYDAIENQLDILDAHILAQIAALKEALKNADEAIREAILAEIAALKEALKNSIIENTTDKYIVNPDSYYVALGDSAAYGKSAELLAEELGLYKKFANLTFENATADQVLANMDAYAADIDKADLVTLGFDANVFTEFVVSQMQAILNSEDPAEMAWAALVGEEAAPYVEEALAELTAKVAEADIPAELAPMIVMMVETYAYTYIAHMADYALVGEAVHAINADALLVLVGMYNPLDGVVLTLGEEKLDLGEYLDYLVCLSNIYSLGYAIYADETIYVDAPDVETSVVAGEQDVVNFIMNLVYNPYAMEEYAPTDAGYQYIQEQIYNALNPELMGLLGDVNSDGKVNSKDAMLMLRWDAELIGADELNLNVGDVNGDGVVNSKDAMLVLRYDAELIDKFPAA